MTINDNSNEGEACGNCICFVVMGQSKIGDKNVRSGYCRLNPPVPVPVQTVAVAKKIVGPADQAQNDVQLRIEPVYPPVHAEMWCRQHLAPHEYPYYKAVALGLVDDGDAQPTQ